MDDLIVNEEKKKENKEVNDSLFIQIQSTHCFHKHKTQVNKVKE